MIHTALLGRVNTKEMNPNIPIQPDEIIRDAQECEKAGASIVHVHARDASGQGTLDIEVFRRILEGIREKTDLLVEFSTGGPGSLGKNAEKLVPLTLGPDLATLNTFLLSSHPDEVPIAFTRSDMENAARYMKEMGVKPVLSTMSISCIEEIERLIEKDLLDKPYFYDVMLGQAAQGDLKATPQNLMSLIERLPEDSAFFVGSHSLTAQVQLTTMGMVLGGHVRVGLEDNVYTLRSFGQKQCGVD